LEVHVGIMQVSHLRITWRRFGMISKLADFPQKRSSMTWGATVVDQNHGILVMSSHAGTGISKESRIHRGIHWARRAIRLRGQGNMDWAYAPIPGPARSTSRSYAPL
jgi:hypothetical protein